MIHLIQVLPMNVRYPSLIIIDNINTSVATQAIKGGFQAYMRSAKMSEQVKDTKGHHRGPMAEAR